MRPDLKRSETPLTTPFPDLSDLGLATVDAGVEWRGPLRRGRGLQRSDARCRDVRVGAPLAGEYVGCQQVDDALWEIYLGPLLLGYVDVTRIDQGLIRL